MENLNQQQEQELSAEQLNEQKEKMLEFYRESMPYLRAQLDYEEMLLKIDEVRLKRRNIQYQSAMMANPPQEEDDQEEDTSEPAKSEGRKLKRG